jgi:hypothetical protein
MVNLRAKAAARLQWSCPDRLSGCSHRFGEPLLPQLVPIPPHPYPSCPPSSVPTVVQLFLFPFISSPGLLSHMRDPRKMSHQCHCPLSASASPYSPLSPNHAAPFSYPDNCGFARLTILPALWLFDDSTWAALGLFSPAVVARAKASSQSGVGGLATNSKTIGRVYDKDGTVPAAASATVATDAVSPQRSLRPSAGTVVAVLLAVLISHESLPVVRNLLSSRQTMNTSFSALKLVNTYGAFGSVTRERNEVVLQATSATDLSGESAGAGAGAGVVEWKDVEFKCKPGALSRAPCLLGPYHLRLDWLAWFAAFQVSHPSLILFQTIYIRTHLAHTHCDHIHKHSLYICITYTHQPHIIHISPTSISRGW